MISKSTQLISMFYS